MKRGFAALVAALPLAYLAIGLAVHFGWRESGAAMWAVSPGAAFVLNGTDMGDPSSGVVGSMGGGVLMLLLNFPYYAALCYGVLCAAFALGKARASHHND
jgi:hypothetical protein